MTAPRGTTEHACQVCGVTVVIAGYPEPGKPILCVSHYGQPLPVDCAAGRHDWEWNDDLDDDPAGDVEICAECGRRKTTR